MNILMVSSYLPYPLFSGGHVRLFNIIKELSKTNTVTLVCEKREYQTEEDIRQLKKYCKQVITFNRKKQWSFSNIIKTGFSKDPFLVVGHTNNEMKRRIEELITTGKFDLIHVETFYVMQNIPKTRLPVVLVEHNIEYFVYKRYARQSTVYLKPFLALDILKLKKVEEHFWWKATKLIAVSEKEKLVMKREDVVVVPNGVDVAKFKIQNSKFKIKGREKRILFIGDFKWIQNRDAIFWILKEIWPRINSKFKSQNSKLKLWIVGRKIPDEIKRLTDDQNVIFDENAPSDTSKIFQQADVLLAPIRVGGGTSFKILESMASGVPVVTTTLGAEGIDAMHEKELLIANTTEEFYSNVKKLLIDEALYKKIAKQARYLIEKSYSWEHIVKKLQEVYTSLYYKQYG